MAQTSDYRLVVIADTPVFYAPLDELFLPEDRKSGAPLEEVNSPTGASDFASGWTFNGTDECLLVPATDLDSVAGWITATGEFSLECWFKKSGGWTPEGSRYLFRWGGYGVFVRLYGFSPGDNTGYVIGGFYEPGATEKVVEEHGTWFNNVWHHVVVTFSRPDLLLYVDGNLVQSESRDFDVQITDTESDFLGIGRDGPFSSGFFPGQIDDVAIYNYPLTETQIDAHYTADKTERTDTEPDIDDPGGPGPRTPPEGIASSFHVAWDTDFGANDGLVDEIRVSLRVIDHPDTDVDDLYFWALQPDFYGATIGEPLGGAHVGLQYAPGVGYPNDHAVNWGGYDELANELEGSESAFPSATDNDNTRDYDWETGVTYDLRVWVEEEGVIRASIDGVLIRELYREGVLFIKPNSMWSEVFAQCSDPSVLVAWSGMEVELDAVTYQEDTFVLNYQLEENDGCPNTNSFVSGQSVRQRTNTTRVNAQDAVLVLDPPPEPGDDLVAGPGFMPIGTQA